MKSHAIFAAALAVMLAAPATAAEGPFPVWLSPWTGVERLEDVPAMLDQRFPLKSYEKTLIIRGPGPDREVMSCNQLFDALGDGYWLEVPPHWRIHGCRRLAWLAKAKPARTSFVRDFKLDADAPYVLPPAFFMAINCDTTTRVYQAERTGQSWAEFSRNFFGDDEGYPVRIGEDGTEVVLRSGKFHVVTDPTKVRRLWGTHFLTGEILPSGPDRADIYGLHVKHSTEIIARADVNDDGVEDLLIATFMRLTDGRLHSSEIFAVTRHEPDAVLRLVDPVKYVARGCEEDHWQEDESFEGLPMEYPFDRWRP